MERTESKFRTVEVKVSVCQGFRSAYMIYTVFCARAGIAPIAGQGELADHSRPERGFADCVEARAALLATLAQGYLIVPRWGGSDAEG